MSYNDPLCGLWYAWFQGNAPLHKDASGKITNPDIDEILGCKTYRGSKIVNMLERPTFCEKLTEMMLTYELSLF